MIAAGWDYFTQARIQILLSEICLAVSGGNLPLVLSNPLDSYSLSVTSSKEQDVFQEKSKSVFHHCQN